MRLVIQFSWLIAIFMATTLLSPARIVEQGAPDHSELHSVILVNLTVQEAVKKENGRIVWRSRISSGREGKETRTGRFFVSHKHRNRISTIYGVPMPYYLRLSGSDFGLHQGTMGYAPGSAGCIRLPKAKARELFERTPIGTPVVIYGKAPTREEAWRDYMRAKRSPRSPSSQRLLNF